MRKYHLVLKFNYFLFFIISSLHILIMKQNIIKIVLLWQLKIYQEIHEKTTLNTSFKVTSERDNVYGSPWG